MRKWIVVALILTLLLGSNAGAAIPLYSGSYQVATGGTIVDPNAAGAATCVGVNGSNVYQYGVNCVQSLTVGTGLANTGTALNPVIALSGTSGVTSITCSGNVQCTSGATPSITGVANPTWTTGTATQFTATATNGFNSTVAYGANWAFAGNCSGGTFGAGANSGVTVQGVTASAWGLGCAGTNLLAISTVGNIGFLNNVTAANFFNGSRRAWKSKIHDFDGLAIVNATDTKQYTCVNPRCGPLGEEKIGIIADDSPKAVAGAKHDHYDGFALAAADTRAIQQLEAQVRALQAQVRSLQHK